MYKKTSLIRWSNDQLPEEVKAAAALEGRSMNAILEDAAAEYVARHGHGSSPTAIRSFALSNSTYMSPTVTYSSLSDAGLDHEDIINQLGGLPGEVLQGPPPSDIPGGEEGD